MVGPGVARLGRTDDVFSDHTDLRPTIVALVGLTDDYVHDGRVLAEDLDQDTLPPSIKNNLDSYIALARAYKAINATKGPLGVASLIYANRSVRSDDATYAQYIDTITAIATERDQLASQMIALLNGAAFEGKSVRDAEDLVERANRLLARVQSLAGLAH
jgi:arylsulfatase A-like enzyme